MLIYFNKCEGRIRNNKGSLHAFTEWSSQSPLSLSSPIQRARPDREYIVHLYAVSRAFFITIKYVHVCALYRESECQGGRKKYWINNAFCNNVWNVLVNIYISIDIDEYTWIGCVVCPYTTFTIVSAYSRVAATTRDFRFTFWSVVRFIPFGNILVLFILRMYAFCTHILPPIRVVGQSLLRSSWSCRCNTMHAFHIPRTKRIEWPQHAGIHRGNGNWSVSRCLSLCPVDDGQHFRTDSHILFTRFCAVCKMHAIDEPDIVFWDFALE